MGGDTKAIKVGILGLGNIGAGTVEILKRNGGLIERRLGVPFELVRAADLDERRAQALGGIALEIENAWLETTTARKKSELLGHSEKVARGWLNSVDQAMNVGTGNARDLVEAARNYFELRLRHLQSMMDANMAQAQLKLATGQL